MELSSLRTSVGRKYLMAVTGILLYGFIVAHMLGNLQIFLGPDWLNAYAKHLQETPLLVWPARVFLLLILFVHMETAIRLSIQNRVARPTPYASQATVQASLASRTMIFSGLAIFAFLIYHLLHFTFGRIHPHSFHLVDSQGRHDVYSMVILSFRDPWVAGSYVAAMIVLAMHLSHGFSSFFQTLGWNTPTLAPVVKKVSRLLALIILAGNTSIPMACFLGWLKPLTGGG